MEETNRRLLIPALTALGCLILVLVLIGLVLRDGAANDSAAIGFPIVLVGLAVVAVIGMFAWKAISKGKSDSK